MIPRLNYWSSLGGYFLIWFSESFLLIINSLINTSKFLWASLLGKTLIHESSSQTYVVHPLGFKTSRRKCYASVCIWKDKVSRPPFPISPTNALSSCLAQSLYLAIWFCQEVQPLSLRKGLWNRVLIYSPIFVPNLYKITRAGTD